VVDALKREGEALRGDLRLVESERSTLIERLRESERREEEAREQAAAWQGRAAEDKVRRGEAEEARR
jgi:hypothetical protein